MVHRDIEISLNLRRVQVQRQHPARTRRFQQVRHKFGGDGHARPVFAVLARVRIIRNHRRDAPSRSTLERVNHQQQLHQVEINRMAAGLHHEYIRAPHIFENLIARLAVAELPVLGLPQRDAHIIANSFRQLGIRCAAKNLEFVVSQDFPSTVHTPPQ